MPVRYYRELLSFLSRLVKDREMAADLAQESFARIYAAKASGQAIRDPRALLYRTARNLVTDQHRRATVRRRFDEAPDDDGPLDPDLQPGPASTEPDAVLAGRQRLAVIAETIASLPPRAREAFVLYKLDGMSRAEVAAAMGIGVKTVETHLAIAMEACLARLQALDGSVEALPESAADEPSGRGRTG
ncbi:MAG: sigma-70 family RNA polymerase sigma factor [Lautropia sp.]